MTSIAAVAGEILARHVDRAYGVMGDGNAHALDAVLKAGVPYTAVRHETAGLSAADAHFRASGRLALASTTYGAGFTNAITGLVEATKAKIPLVFLAGGAGAELQEWDVDEAALCAAMGIRSVSVRDEASLEGLDAEVRAALRDLAPLVVLIAADHAKDECVRPQEFSADDDGHRDSPTLEQGEIDEVVKLLGTAERPLILGGRGLWVSGGRDRAAELAERLDARTSETIGGRGLFPQERSFGVCGGFAPEHSAALIASADVVVSLGASLNQFQMRFGEAFGDDAVLIQVDTDPDRHHPRANTFVHADASDVVDALIEACEAGSIPARQRWTEEIEGLPEPTTLAEDSRVEEGAAPFESRLHPALVIEKVNEILPAERTVVLDGGHFVGWPARGLRAADPSGYLMVGSAYKCIGLGTGSAVGAAHARPERMTVLVTGDGGLQMGLGDLITLARSAGHDAGRVCVLVMNDGQYGAEIHQFGPLGLSMEPAILGEVDFADLSYTLEGAGIHVHKLEDLVALEHWVAGDRPFAIVDCRIDGDIVAPFFDEVRKRIG